MFLRPYHQWCNGCKTGTKLCGECIAPAGHRLEAKHMGQKLGRVDKPFDRLDAGFSFGSKAGTTLSGVELDEFGDPCPPPASQQAQPAWGEAVKLKVKLVEPWSIKPVRLLDAGWKVEAPVESEGVEIRYGARRTTLFSTGIFVKVPKECVLCVKTECYPGIQTCDYVAGEQELVLTYEGEMSEERKKQRKKGTMYLLACIDEMEVDDRRARQK